MDFDGSISGLVPQHCRRRGEEIFRSGKGEINLALPGFQLLGVLYSIWVYILEKGVAKQMVEEGTLPR